MLFFPYRNDVFDDLKEVILKPIVKLLVNYQFGKRPSFIYLQHNANDGIVIGSEMNHVVDYFEIGRLYFNKFDMYINSATIIHEETLYPRELQKLVYKDGDVISESGVLIRCENNIDLVICSGVAPYSVAIFGVSGAASMTDSSSEYNLEDYIREKF